MESSAEQRRRRLKMWTIGEINPVAEKDGASHADQSSTFAAGDRSAGEIARVDAFSAKLLSDGAQEIELDGFCELPNGVDRSCRTMSIGPQAVDIVYQDILESGDKRATAQGNFLNETVHLDLDHVGKFHGIMTAHNADGFHVAVDPNFSGLLLTKLARYMAHAPQAQATPRRTAASLPVKRIVPKNTFCTYRDQSGILHKGSIVSISPLDAMVKSRVLPDLNAMVTFCGSRPRKAHVIRRLDSGFGALFVDPLGDQEFSADLRLTDEF